MTDLRTIAVVLLLLVSLALGWFAREQYHKTAQLKKDLATATELLAREKLTRKSEVAAMTTRLKAAKTAQETKEKRDDATYQALQKNPQWASDRVPDDVVDALGL